MVLQNCDLERNAEFVQSRIQPEEHKVLHSFIASNIKKTCVLFENISV